MQASLTVLLDLAAQASVEIGALAGDPWWGSPDGLVDATEVLDGLAEVNHGRENTVQALHLDVEPWGLGVWSQLKTTLVADYLTFVSDILEVRNNLDGSPIHLSFLVPFWFDGTTEEVPSVQQDGVTAYPFQHLEAQDSEAVTWIVMAYRDRAQGEGGVISLLDEELAVSDRVGLALETAQVEPLSITFADETISDLDREIASLLAANLGLDEIVINDLEHLRILADSAADG